MTNEPVTPTATPTPPEPTQDTRVLFGPPAPTRLGRSRPVDAIDLRRRDVASVLAAAVTGDLALRHLPGGNVAGTTFLLTLIVGLVVSGRATSPLTRRCLAAAAFFAVMLAVRSDPRLVVFNGLAALFLIVLAAAPPARFFDTRPIQALRNTVEATAVSFGLVFQLPAQTRAQQRQRVERGASSQTGAILRGIGIALPILVVLGLLLASADAVFASFFASTPVSFTTGFSHLVLLPIGALTMAILFRLRATDTGQKDHPRPPGIGRTEALVVLGLLDALFALFAIAQVIARSKLGETALLDGGLTHREHARQGFFQLLWVASITLGVLLSVRSTTLAWSRTSRAFRVLSLTAVGLTLVIVGVAFSRLQLYIGDNGLTPLRFYSSIFSLWIGLGFVLVAARLLDWLPDRAWMLPALVVSGLATLAILDIANPDAIIARDNLGREGRALVWHVDKLSGDGLSVVIDGLDQLDPAVRDELTTELCDDQYSRHDRSDHDGLGWNLGDRRGTQALAELCSRS